MELECLTPEAMLQALPELATLLRDAVEGGASIGFLLPLTAAEAIHYWREVADALRRLHRILLAARIDQNIVGTVQLDLAIRLYATSTPVARASNLWINAVGRISRICTNALNPKMTATELRKVLSRGATLLNIQGPAPTNRAIEINTAVEINNSSQACRSDSEGIIVLLTAKAR
jgi:hypothetical protein